MAKMNFTEANLELSSYVLIGCADIGLFDSVGYRSMYPTSESITATLNMFR